MIVVLLLEKSLSSPVYVVANELLKNLRGNLSLGVVEVALINEEQFVIKRIGVNLIELVAHIPKLIDNLRMRINDSSLSVCSIDGDQKVVKRKEPNTIEILSDIVPIDENGTNQSLSSNITSASLPVILDDASTSGAIIDTKLETPPKTNGLNHSSGLVSPSVDACR